MNFMPGWFPGAAGAGGGKESIFPVIAGTSNDHGSTDFGPTYDVPLPAGINSGDLLILFGSIRTSAGPNTRTISTPSGWTSLYNGVGGGTLRRYYAFYKVASGSEGASVAVTASGPANWANIVYRITDYQGAPEISSPTTGTSTAPNPGNLTPSWGSAKTLWITVQHDDAFGDGEPTMPSNYGTLLRARSNLGVPRTSGCYRELEASSEDAGAWTIGSSNWAAITVAIRPA